MKLLLDFGASPDAIVTTRGELEDPRLRQRSLLSIAVYNGMADAAKMLLKYNANPHPATGMEPLLAALNNETRAILEVLLENRPADVLMTFDGKPFIVYAIELESNLLPVIVTRVQIEIQKMQERGAKDIPRFPPKHLSRKQKKALKKAIKFNDLIIATGAVENEVNWIKCPWRKTVDEDDDFEALSS